MTSDVAVGVSASRVVGRTETAASAEDVRVPLEVPWTLSDLQRVVRAVGLGVSGLAVAWVVASGTVDVQVQGWSVVAGVLATGVVAIGCAGWLASGLRALQAERTQVRARIAGLLRDRGGVVGAAPLTTGLLTAAGMTHAHLATCVMARGKDLRRPRRGEDLAACPVCRPEPLVGEAA